MHNISMFGLFLFVDGELPFVIRDMNFSLDIASVMTDVSGLFVSIFSVLSV
jgi:hypothetical protein